MKRNNYYVIEHEVKMSIDKFGSHILFKDQNKSLEYRNVSSSSSSEILNIVDINKVKLYYNIVLPFIGNWDAFKDQYLLLQDGRTTYVFPFNEGYIEKVEYPKEDVTLHINGKEIPYGTKSKIISGDVISFHNPSKSTRYLPTFYGELVIKCPILIEQ